jgi:hypothetical protein
LFFAIVHSYYNRDAYILDVGWHSSPILPAYSYEMSRILKSRGLLLTSTDYWPDKIINTRTLDNVFSREEITNMIEAASENGLTLIEPIDFTYEDKVVYWHKTDLYYTFIFFALKKAHS